MIDKYLRKWVLIILLLTAGLRFCFLVFGEIPPVMGDARHNVSAALGVISFFDDSGAIPFLNDSEDSYRFNYYDDKYIQGEKIDWSSYDPYTLTKAREEIISGGPLYPALLAAVFYLSPEADFIAVRVIGILMDIFSVLLLIGIGIRVVGRKPALVAGCIFALYFPFILTSNMLLHMSSTIFLFLLSIYLLLLSDESNKRIHLILSGIIFGLLLLNEPTAMLLIIPIGIWYYFVTMKKISFPMYGIRIFSFLIPVIMIFSSWAIVTYSKYDRFSSSFPEFTETNQDISSPIMLEGYNLDKLEPGFEDIYNDNETASDPAGYTGLMVKKFDRLWGRPYNDFKQTFLLPYFADELIHKIIIYLSIAGLILMMVMGLKNWLLIFLISVYYTGIHTVFNSMSKYNLIAMPFLIMVAAYFIYEIYSTVITLDTKVKKKLLIAFALLLIFVVIDYNFINVFIVPTFSLIQIFYIAKLLMISLLLFYLLHVIFKDINIFQKSAVSLSVVLLITLFSWSQAFSRDAWSEYDFRLDDEKMKIGSRIYISEFEEVKPGEMLAVLVDLNSSNGRKNSFSVTAAGLQKDYIGGRREMSGLFYYDPVYHYQAQLESIGLENYRQYAFVPLNDSLIGESIKSNGYLDISVAINNRIQEDNNCINLYGRFLTASNYKYMPSIRFTSIERYIQRNDPRIRYPIEFLSDTTISYYINRTTEGLKSGIELSSTENQHAGGLNIYLVRFMPDGSFKVY